MAQQWPLIGRSAELRQVRSYLTSRGPRGVVLAGAAGVGKTRLAQECLRLAERMGLPTACVVATRSAAALPFGALAPLLPGISPGEANQPEEPVDLVRRCSQALAQRAAGRRLVLLVDDCHLLDPASATLIHQLATGDKAFLLATTRSGESAPDAVLALWKDGLAERIELGELAVDSVQALLPAALGGPVDPATVAELAARCHGNVLFLRELVLGALGDGTLTDDGGIWRLVAALSPSQRLVEIVEARLVGLDPDERALLELVSFGEPLVPAELSRLADPALAEGLERRGLLTVSRTGPRMDIHLAHPLYGDVLRARTPAMRVPKIALALAEMFEARAARRPEDILRIATLRLESGGGDPEVLLAAARTARWSYDFPLAERLATAALEAGAGVEAAVLAAQLAGLQGRGTEAETALAQLAGTVTDDAQRGLIAVTRLDNYAVHLGHIDEGLAMAAEAEATIADSYWRDEINAKRSTLLLGAKGPTAALEIVEPLVARAEGRTLVWACAVAAYALDRVGRPSAALQAAARGHAANATLPRPLDWYPWLHLVHRCEALTHSGRLDEAEALATAQYQTALADKSPEAQAFFAWQRGTVALERGQVETASSHGCEALALFRRLGRPQFEQFCLHHIAHALALGGHTVEAVDALTKLDELGLPRTHYFGVELLQAKAWVAVSSGDPDRAHQLLTEAGLLGKDIGDRVGETAALHDLARLGHAEQVAARLTSLAGEVEGALVTARAAHATALLTGDPQALAAVSVTFERMGAYLPAAEAAGAAATAWPSGEDPRALAALRHRATELAARCEGAHTPALPTCRTWGPRLTPAEEEAARRAAEGLSNKQIAADLCLSVRTVENRLLRAYAKLGLTGRGQLAAALSLPEPAPAATDPRASPEVRRTGHEPRTQPLTACEPHHNVTPTDSSVGD
jgi:DNA-binding CsgD family transcriptional regulator